MVARGVDQRPWARQVLRLPRTTCSTTAATLMTVPLLSVAQVRILAEQVIQPSLAPDSLPADLAPSTPFDQHSIRAGLPDPGPFQLADLRFWRRLQPTVRACVVREARPKGDSRLCRGRSGGPMLSQHRGTGRVIGRGRGELTQRPRLGVLAALQRRSAMSAPDVSSRTIAQLISLEGRTAVVTGGARGIGRAIATRFAEAGANVLIGDVDKTGAEESAETIAREFGHQAIGVELDVTNGTSIAAAADRAVRELGGLDIWVNNAGIYPSTPLLEMTDQDWDKVLDVNLRGTFIGAREAGRRMAEAGRGGVIINLASTAGYRAAGPGIAHYVSSKHAVRGLTKSLAVEFGPRGIRVLALAPTLIETPGIEEGRAAFQSAGLGDMLEQMAQREPLGRVGVPDDVARVALFCASDLAMLMTGSTLLVDAGDVAL